jgi:hypothetical protein
VITTDLSVKELIIGEIKRIKIKKDRHWKIWDYELMKLLDTDNLEETLNEMGSIQLLEIYKRALNYDVI